MKKFALILLMLGSFLGLTSLLLFSIDAKKTDTEKRDQLAKAREAKAKKKEVENLENQNDGEEIQND